VPRTGYEDIEGAPPESATGYEDVEGAGSAAMQSSKAGGPGYDNMGREPGYQDIFGAADGAAGAVTTTVLAGRATDNDNRARQQQQQQQQQEEVLQGFAEMNEEERDWMEEFAAPGDTLGRKACLPQSMKMGAENNGSRQASRRQPASLKAVAAPGMPKGLSASAPVTSATTPTPGGEEGDNGEDYDILWQTELAPGAPPPAAALSKSTAAATPGSASAMHPQLVARHQSAPTSLGVPGGAGGMRARAGTGVNPRTARVMAFPGMPAVEAGGYGGSRQRLATSTGMPVRFIVEVKSSLRK
jgi:hypothetical protein